jgi:hypothetical protein
MDRVLIVLWVAAAFGCAGFAIIRRTWRKDSSRQAGSDGASPHGESRRSDDLDALDGDGGNGETVAVGEMAVAEIESPSNRRRAGPVRRAQIAQQLGRRLP